jgi:phenylacetate 2-hydroxylase
MVSGGIDTLPGHLTMGLAYLASPLGQGVQNRAYTEILKAYPDGDAWERCLIEEKVPYIIAFVKETLRFWSIVPMGLPRVSTNDIEWEGTIIPAGTTFMMVRMYFPSDPFAFFLRGGMMKVRTLQRLLSLQLS